MTETLDRNQLKVIALKERLATIVVEYEDKDAERRITLTEYQQRITELEAEVARLQPDTDATEVLNDAAEEA